MVYFFSLKTLPYLARLKSDTLVTILLPGRCDLTHFLRLDDHMQYSPMAFTIDFFCSFGLLGWVDDLWLPSQAIDYRVHRHWHLDHYRPPKHSQGSCKNSNFPATGKNMEKAGLGWPVFSPGVGLHPAVLAGVGQCRDDSMFLFKPRGLLEWISGNFPERSKI